MDIKNYDKIELAFEEFSIILSKDIIEKFQIEKVEQFIEAQYNPEDEYNVYIVIDRIRGEEVWKEEISIGFNRNSR